MDEKIASARKEVLVELVKMAQKRGMKGSKGTWKEFLSVFDKKFGSSLSDPTRRSTDALAAFLNTFSQKDDLKFFDKVMRCHSNRDAVEQFKEKSEEVESPEQGPLSEPRVCLGVGLRKREYRGDAKTCFLRVWLSLVNSRLILCEEQRRLARRLQLLEPWRGALG
ncbi:small RNA degrading nuclease 3 [Actinidia rufa]|uniref:Small RNA degrading nuclease 3 n=1 Tax=Actinidia rufa TaxID=165716 RepID=A0A7J0H6T8_9ERIC|nr:small RNA degrading nuclease 3 [Actinidia rufa]